MNVLNIKLHDAGGMTILWGHYATEESSVENRADFSVRLCLFLSVTTCRTTDATDNTGSSRHYPYQDS